VDVFRQSLSDESAEKKLDMAAKRIHRALPLRRDATQVPWWKNSLRSKLFALETHPLHRDAGGWRVVRVCLFQLQLLVCHRVGTSLFPFFLTRPPFFCLSRV
jgi:hypothetical protein